MVRGIRAALNSSGRYTLRKPGTVVDNLVIGGGVVGLAIGARLSKRADQTTVVVERHAQVGQETSSRNSEVIHAGLYYPTDSLKTHLCLRGRHLLKQYCHKHNVPHAWSGKLVVAREEQVPYIVKLYSHSQMLATLGARYPMPRTDLVTGDMARVLQPDLSDDIAAGLWSHDTGIVDSHALMQALEAEIGGSEGGDIALSTRVVRVDPVSSNKGPEQVGWIVQVLTGDSNQPDAILAKNLINASGLSANLVLNSLARTEDERIPLYFARGSYASYRGPGVGDVNKLLYPVPPSGPKSKDAHGFQGLGTHLTLDLGGNIKFGPDVEWIEPPKGVDEKDEETIDFWQAHHRPTESEEKLAAIHESVTEYLPGIKKEGLSIDYAGIRPKIGGPTAGFQDFQFRIDRSDGNGNTGAPMVTLLGIESPGLTSALAIAEHVDDLLARSATTQAMLN